MDPQWEPVKEYIRKDLGVNTDREQCWWDEWDEGALRQILAQQKKITQQSKQLGMKKLYQVLIVLDDMADSPQVHKKTGDGILDTLFIRGRHYCINTWVSTQKLRLMPSAVRVNTMWYCVFRLRNQLELDALVEELSAMLPKDVLYGMYQEATREKYSFWYVNLRAPKEDMFWLRFDRKFLVNEHGDDPQPGGGETAGGAARCATVSATTSSAAPARSESSTPRGPTQSGPGRSARAPRRRCGVFGVKGNAQMATIYCDSRKRVAGDDASFEMDIGETIHLQTGAKLTSSSSAWLTPSSPRTEASSFTGSTQPSGA